jgi:adenylate cyclase
VVGCIQVTERTYRRLRDRYRFQRRGPVQVRGKGELVTWFLLGRIEAG